MESNQNLNEELENYFNNTIIPQLFVDAQLILRKFTPPAMTQFSLHPDFIGKPIQQIKDHFRFPTLIDNIKMVIQSGEILEKEIQTNDFEWYQMNILPYYVRRENRTNGVIVTFVNITSRIRDLREQENMVAEYQMLLDTIAHDIKNPISALQLSLQALEQQSGSTGRETLLLKNMFGSITAIKKVVEDLTLEHWNRDGKQSNEELLDLGNILEDVRLALAPQIMESGAFIRQRLDAVEVKFVRRKLRSVLYNLLANAINYTATDVRPEIEISSYSTDSLFIIVISDNGIGISQKDQGSIFEKFQRLNPEKEGSGVGLYLVNGIIMSAGGKIHLESAPGKGSVFKICLKQQQAVH